MIHPFASSAAKRWPMENFRAVAEALGRAGQMDRRSGRSISTKRCASTISIELACWLASARAYIGNDSGIAHLAAAVGTPVVAIFLEHRPAYLGAARQPRNRAGAPASRAGVVEAARRIMRGDTGDRDRV